MYPIRSDGSDGAWRWGKDKVEREANRIEWVNGRAGWTPYYRIYADQGAGRPPETIWTHQEVGSNRTSKLEVTRLFKDDKAFDTPKPERLISRILELSTDRNDLVLDSFAGSGTTGAVAQKMQRRFLIAEMTEASSIKIAARLKMVCDGSDDGGVSALHAWSGGGGFRFCNLGRPLFDEWGGVNEGVTYADLAAFVFFSDTGSPIPAKATGETSMLGTYQGRAVHLLFAAGSLGVANEGAGNVLTLAALEALPAHDGPRIVYAEGCTVPTERLAADGIVFKQVPYQLQAT